MEIKDIVKELTLAVVSRQDLCSDPSAAADDVLTTYNILLVNLADASVSQDALQLAVSAIRKPEVDLGDPPALGAEKIYRRIFDKI
jgi:hypothetical protein